VLATLTLLIYALLYTPLKRHSSLATVVGRGTRARCRPLIGWVGAGDRWRNRRHGRCSC
jgi:heme O synthase-like polyprenyltransferase